MSTAMTTQGALTALVPTNIQQAMQLASMMSNASLIPQHLQGKEGDCLLVIMQACRWGMDALSVAQCTSVVRGKLCYEGKLVAAVLVAMGAVSSRLRYEYSGSGQNRSIRVIGRLAGETEDREVSGSVSAWATQNDAWKRDPDMMLGYRGARQWARMHAPDAMLGIHTPDEIEDAITVEARPAVTLPQRLSASVADTTAVVEPQAHTQAAQAVDIDPETGEVVTASGAELSAMPTNIRNMVIRKLEQAGLTVEQLAAAHPGIGSVPDRAGPDANTAFAWIKAQQQ